MPLNDIKIRCDRCHEPFWLQPGFPLTQFCETCVKRYGKRLFEDAQFGLNARYQFCKEQLNRAPSGSDAYDPFRVYSK